MQLITEIPIPKGGSPIDYHSKILSLGSCFAENMADKFAYFNFSCLANPFGILFHPLAIERFLRFSVEGKQFSGADVFFHNGRWHSFDAHSGLSAAEKEVIIGNLQNATASTKHFLRGATHAIITLGTAWVYRSNDSGALVANCHKVPQREFSKELLTPEAIAESLENTMRLLRKINPGVQIILTVSPVRHIKDGFAENQRSKAHLLTALHRVLEAQSGHYFPSYEIMMDELRDYRFYAEDMLHPSQTAIDYIWEKFAHGWISPAAFPVMEEVAAIRKALAHRPFNPDSESHRNFRASTEGKIALLQSQYPHISFE